MIRNATREPPSMASISARTCSTSLASMQRGAVIQRVKFRRETLLAFFERAAPQPWSAWRLARARSGWRASCRRWGTRSASCQRSS